MKTAEQFRQDPDSYVATVTKTCERRTELVRQAQGLLWLHRIRVESSLAKLEHDVREALREIEQ